MSDRELTALQQNVNEIASTWPDVRAKLVFGHRGWVRNGKMFGFLADDGVAVKTPAGPEADAAYARHGVHAFAHGGMEMRAWPILPLRSESDLEFALTSLQAACDRAVVT